LVDEETKFWSHVPLFQALPAELIPEIKAASEHALFKPGEEIIREGEQGNSLYIIKQGEAKVESGGNFLSTLRSGDYFGELALLRGEPRTATITAVTAIGAMMITRAAFNSLKLHERIDFTKEDKITRRHRMLASGAAGVRCSPADEASRALMASMAKQNKTAVAPSNYCQTQLRALRGILCSKLHLSAFVLVPLGQGCKFMDLGPGAIFASNFMAVVPLASLLGQATEALSCHTGQLLGGLLNATFGNVVEMIMCIQAVRAGLISVVQGALLGSVLSNLLLVLGMAIFASGTIRKSSDFNAKGAAANMTCQLVASISICLPTCFSTVSETIMLEQELMISRICSVFLIIVYVMFLYFMLKTHADLFADEDEEEADADALSPTLSAVLLFACTVVVFLCSECLVDAIEGVSEGYGLSKAFIGIILLPIVGNAAEHATAVTAAYKGMMDLALGVAVGSSTQIALFVVPSAVMFGWVWDQPMNLNFSVFDTTCLMLTVFLVSQVLAHGETNWLHGAMLVVVYVFIAVQTLFIPSGMS